MDLREIILAVGFLVVLGLFRVFGSRLCLWLLYWSGYTWDVFVCIEVLLGRVELAFAF